MKKLILVSLVTTILLSVALSGCGADEDISQAEAVDQFSGKTVGVMLAWDSDYALSPRKDLKLMRYDNTPDMVMALSHGKIDAIAIDDMSARIIERMVQGLEIVKPGVGKFGYCAGFNERNSDLLEDYNQFVSKYVKTEAHADLKRRMDEFDGIDFEEGDVFPTGTGRVLRVAYPLGNFPSSYWDTVSDSFAGFDVEPLITWANDRNYAIEVTGTTFEDMLMGLTQGSFDVAVGAISELYDRDMSLFGNHCSTPVNYLTNYFMVRSEDEISPGSEFFEIYE